VTLVGLQVSSLEFRSILHPQPSTLSGFWFRLGGGVCEVINALRHGIGGEGRGCAVSGLATPAALVRVQEACAVTPVGVSGLEFRCRG